MIEEKIKNLIIERYGSLVAFSEKIGLPNSTIDSILRRGIGKGKVENVMLICKELQISIDGLRYGIIKPVTFINTSREEIESIAHKGLENLSRKEAAEITKHIISFAEDVSDKEKKHLLSSIDIFLDEDDSQ